MYDDDFDDDYDDYEDEDSFCLECQGTGRVPAMDFEAISGHSYFACPACEKGLNSGYPWRN